MPIKNISELGNMVDQKTIVVVTLGELRKAIGYERLGKYVLDEISSSLEGDGLGTFRLMRSKPIQSRDSGRRSAFIAAGRASARSSKRSRIRHRPAIGCCERTPVKAWNSSNRSVRWSVQTPLYRSEPGSHATDDHLRRTAPAVTNVGPSHQQTRTKEDVMTLQAWLLTIKEPQDSLVDATTWTLWTEPHRDRLTRDVRRRSDDEPFTPQWGAGEDVFIYSPDTGRVIAWLTLDDAPEYDETDERFYITASVEIYDASGPTLAEIGVELAVQGGRQRLTPAQHGAAVRVLRQASGQRAARVMEAADGRATKI